MSLPRLLGRATAALSAGLLVALVPGTAWAAELDAAGWWWRENPGQGSITPSPLPQVTLPQQAPAPPKPPDVPEGGLLVERDPDGTAALGAVRFSLSASETSPTLVLPVAGSQGTPELLACQTGSGWSAAEGGRFDSKPLVACDASQGGGSVSGVVAGDGKTVTFSLAPLVLKSSGGGGSIDVAIVPAKTGAPATPFRITFAKVTSAALKTESGSFDGGFTAPALPSFSDTSTPAFDTGGFAGGSTSPVPAPSVGDATTPLVQPDLPVADQGLSATAPAIRNQTEPAVAVPKVVTGNGNARVIAFAIVLLMIGAAYALTRQRTPGLAGLVPLRTRRPLEAVRVERAGGLGRFVRPRTEAPSRLA